MILGIEFYSQPTKQLARSLLGTFLVHDSPQGRTVGRIVETEAYLSQNDPACHASRGKTKRNAAMFGPAGTSYVYLIYGMYYCFNVVSGKEGEGEAVLVRALEPVEGIPLMQKRRGVENIPELASGPGKLVMAMGITANHNFGCLRTGLLKIHATGSFESPDLWAGGRMKCSPRVGITVGAELPLRFFLDGNPFVSRR